MPRLRHYVGPPWPPSKGAYDYALALCPSDLAWEFLRRSPAYQRDYRLNCKGITRPPRCFGLVPQLTRIRRRVRFASFWGLTCFADPETAAPNSPVCWAPTSAVPFLEVLANRSPGDNNPDLSVRDLTSVRHVVLGPASEQYILLRDADTSLTLRLQGSRASRAPVSTSILLPGLPDPEAVSKALGHLGRLVRRPNHHPNASRDLLFIRDALIALDGRCVGASYREIAAVIYGWQKVRVAWSSRSRWMKDRICRAFAKGENLREGGYRKLLE